MDLTEIDADKLKALIDRQNNEVAFYCGIASDNKKIMKLFNQSFVLKVDPEELNNRLLVREGTDDYANTEAGRKRVLAGKDEFENDMVQAGMTIIDATTDDKRVATEIINLIG